MKDQEFVIEKIRSQYTEDRHTELNALKALDARVKKPAHVFGYIYEEYEQQPLLSADRCCRFPGHQYLYAAAGLWLQGPRPCSAQ